MSFASKVIYEGDAVTKDFNVPMPYLSQSHVFVYVNEVLQLNPMHYTWSGPSTIRFDDAPGLGAAIEIKRWTSPTATLVDFTDGSTLRADDLDTAYLHNYYLQQEYVDSFNEVINNALVSVATGAGIIETETDEVIAALVNEMLNQSAAATLQQRVNDIDTNAEAIISLGESLQVQINTLAEAAAATVFVQGTEPVPGVGGVPDPIPEGARWYDTSNNNAPYIYQSGAWVSITDPRIGEAQADITVLQAETSGNSAALLSESLVRSQQFEALASQLDLIGVANADMTAFVLDLNTVEIDQTSGTTLAQKFSLLETEDANNAASILSEQTARIAGDSSNASDITALDVRLTTAEGDILSQSSAITVLQTDVATNSTDIGLAEGDIATNASAITALQSEVDLRNRTFYQSTQPTASNAGDLWIDSDDDTLWRWNGSVWTQIQDAAIAANASAITALDTEVTTNAGAISSNASSITTLQADVTTLDGRVDSAEVNITANATAITNAEGDITTLEAKYGVTLGVNNYITGFAQNNDGTTGNFVVLADKFAIVTPQLAWTATTAKSLEDTIRPTVHNGRVYECTTAGTTGGSEPSWPTTLGATVADGSVVWTCRDDSQYTPFIVTGDRVRFNTDVEINGSLILNGTIVGAALVNGTIGSTQIGTNAISTTHISANSITANEIAANQITGTEINGTNLSAIFADLGTITAGTITLNSTGHIKSGQTAFATGTGWWLGIDSGTPKFSIGNTTDFLSWDGTELKVRGNLSLGNYSFSTTDVLLSAPTERYTSSLSWIEVKKFKINKPGTIRVYWDRRCTSVTGGSTGHNSEWRVKLDGVVKSTTSAFTTTWATVNSGSITTTETSEYVTIEYTSGERNPVEPVPCGARIRNAEIRALIDFGEAVITD